MVSSSSRVATLTTIVVVIATTLTLLSSSTLTLVAAAAGGGADHYAALGIDKTATKAQIRKAYRRYSLKYHPDKNMGDDSAAAKFTAANEAYEVLGDDDQRLIYDEFGSGEEFTNRFQYMQSQKGKQGKSKSFYQGHDLIRTLHQKRFDETVAEGTAVIEFYAPWCVHCQQMTGVYKKAATLLEGVAIFGAVNCENNKRLCSMQGVRAYPTIRIYDKGEVDVYDGEHKAEAMYKFVRQYLNSEVTKLTPLNFDSVVTQSEDMWVIDFSAGRWCGPCTALKPTLRSFAASIAGASRVGIFECDRYGDWCSEHGVSYYPFLAVYPKGQKHPDGIGTELEYNNNKMPSINVLDQIRIVAIASGVKSGNLRGGDDDEEFMEDELAAGGGGDGSEKLTAEQVMARNHAEAEAEAANDGANVVDEEDADDAMDRAADAAEAASDDFFNDHEDL